MDAPASLHVLFPRRLPPVLTRYAWLAADMGHPWSGDSSSADASPTCCRRQDQLFSDCRAVLDGCCGSAPTHQHAAAAPLLPSSCSRRALQTSTRQGCLAREMRRRFEDPGLSVEATIGRVSSTFPGIRGGVVESNPPQTYIRAPGKGSSMALLRHVVGDCDPSSLAPETPRQPARPCMPLASSCRRLSWLRISDNVHQV